MAINTFCLFCFIPCFAVVASSTALFLVTELSGSAIFESPMNHYTLGEFENWKADNLFAAGYSPWYIQPCMFATAEEAHGVVHDIRNGRTVHRVHGDAGGGCSQGLRLALSGHVNIGHNSESVFGLFKRRAEFY